MFFIIAGICAIGAIGSLVYNWETKSNGGVSSEHQVQAEWLGYYNNLEATLLKTNPKVYNEDIAKAALIFSGATYEKLLSGFEGCLPEFKINT